MWMFVEGSVVTCIKCIRKDPSVIKLNHKRNKGPMFFRNQLYTPTLRGSLPKSGPLDFATKNTFPLFFVDEEALVGIY